MIMGQFRTLTRNSKYEYNLIDHREESHGDGWLKRWSQAHLINPQYNGNVHARPYEVCAID